jgi:hypothetical protein
MLKSILAVSEGGPDAAMSFRLAARVAGIFDATVDALHLPVGPAGGAIGGLAMSGEAMPLIMNLDDARLEERAKESNRAYKEVLGSNAGSTYTAAETATLDTLVAMGRCSDLLVLGRPGSDPENVAPATVEAAIHECARPVMIAPPNAGSGGFGSVIVACRSSRRRAPSRSWSSAPRPTMSAPRISRAISAGTASRPPSTPSIPAPCRAVPADAPCSTTRTARAPTF